MKKMFFIYIYGCIYCGCKVMVCVSISSALHTQMYVYMNVREFPFGLKSSFCGDFCVFGTYVCTDSFLTMHGNGSSSGIL